VRGLASLSTAGNPLTPALSPTGRGSTPSWRTFTHTAMAVSNIPMEPALADEPADAAIVEREVLAGGFRPYQRLRAQCAGEGVETRDVLRAGAAVAVLPIDVERGEVVLIRQFRVAAQLANDRGNLVEIVAGHVEANETPRETARRECLEEIGVAPRLLVELFTYLTSPGLTDEEVTVFLGVVDASRAALAADGEREASALLRAPIAVALSALGAGTVRNGPLVTALQWLALNRGRLADVVRTGSR
jgi:ADP-ribose diphosphatase